MNAETLDFLRSSIEEQDTECDINIVKTQELADDTGFLVIFEFLDKQDDRHLGETAAVVYHDGTCFTRSDWQDGCYPEDISQIENFDWYDLKNGQGGVILDGAPRVF